MLHSSILPCSRREGKQGSDDTVKQRVVVKNVAGSLKRTLRASFFRMLSPVSTSRSFRAMIAMTTFRVFAVALALRSLSEVEVHTGLQSPAVVWAIAEEL